MTNISFDKKDNVLISQLQEIVRCGYMMMSDGRSNHWIHYSFQSFPLVWRRNQPWWISRLENCPILKQPPPWKEHDAMIESQNVIIEYFPLNFFGVIHQILWQCWQSFRQRASHHSPHSKVVYLKEITSTWCLSFLRCKYLTTGQSFGICMYLKMIKIYCAAD